MRASRLGSFDQRRHVADQQAVVDGLAQRQAEAAVHLADRLGGEAPLGPDELPVQAPEVIGGEPGQLQVADTGADVQR